MMTTILYIHVHVQLHSLGHYSTYAIGGKGGKLLWKHEPGDFEVHPAYESTSPFVVSIHGRIVKSAQFLHVPFNLFLKFSLAYEAFTPQIYESPG